MTSTNTQRMRSGPSNPITAPVGASYGIQIGDLVWWDSANQSIRSAADVPDQSTAAATRKYFHDRFVGVARSGKRTTDTTVDSIQVEVEGEFDFSCASATANLGDLVGPVYASSALDPQLVIVTGAGNVAPVGGTEQQAIGRITRHYPSATTTLRVRIVGTMTLGGPAEMAT